MACLRPQKAPPPTGSKGGSDDFELVQKPAHGASAKNGSSEKPAQMDEETIEEFKLLLKNALSGGAM